MKQSKKDPVSASANDYHGILLVDKPRGFTSHDVVSFVRKLLQQKRIGHAGTLDPDAEGLLVLCLGQATKISSYLQASHKTYESVFTLGISTNTLDSSGEITAWEQCPLLNIEDIQNLLHQFIGETMQQVPHYAAVSLSGQRLYNLARKGISFEPPTRKILVTDFILKHFYDTSIPKIAVSVTCSAGTYIRGLARDIGKSLGIPSHMSFLRRTKSGFFNLEDAYTLDKLKTMTDEELRASLLPVSTALAFLPAAIIADEDAQHVSSGWSIKWSEDDDFDKEIMHHMHDKLIRIHTESGFFCALYKINSDGFAYPKRVFPDFFKKELSLC